jgi:dTDP-4-dehydrorhamnose reductase
MSRIAVTGAAGQLGSELCRRLGERAVGLDLPEADITSPAILEMLAAIAPSAVINAAAYTNVDRAETEAEVCRAVNVKAVARLADYCQAADIPLVHVSTDYVFGGDREPRRPWRETDPPSPQGVYARGKWESEQEAARWRRSTIVRTCGLYARATGGREFRNFVRTMLRLAEQGGPLRVVRDQHCTPSYVPHVAAAILYLLEGQHAGTYHVVNQGETTWYDFALEVFRQAGVSVEVAPITSAEFGAVAPRPAYSVLDTTKYHALGGPPLPDWRSGVAEYLVAGGPLDGITEGA